MAERVSRNVKDLRGQARLSLTELAERIRAVGRNMRGTSIIKIEQGDRRVDVDDLVAIALALDVNPNRLLLDPQADDQPQPLTHKVTANRRQAWVWAAGDEPLPAPGEFPFDLDRARDFGLACRPHDPPGRLTLDDLAEHDPALRPLAMAIREALAAGISSRDIVDYTRAVARLYAITEDVGPGVNTYHRSIDEIAGAAVARIDERRRQMGVKPPDPKQQLHELLDDLSEYLATEPEKHQDEEEEITEEAIARRLHQLIQERQNPDK